jgi:periplasmic protein TonB
MSALAEDSLETTSAKTWVMRIVIGVVVIALIVGLTIMLKNMLSSPTAAKRQTAKISILPDTPPPPPPPPPKEEKKPEPVKEQVKQEVREQPVKQDAPKPVDAPIKMDGPAGDGPSAFAAGSVTNEYKGGAPVIAAVTSSAAGNAVDRTQERFYANSVKQLLQAEIEKNLRADAGEQTATFSVWVEPDGSIRRFELVPSGDAARDADLRAAFDTTSRRLRLPTHNGLPQPMRFKLSMRPA